MWVKMKTPVLAMFNFTNARKVTGSADQNVQNPHRLKINECGNNVLKKSPPFPESAKTKLSDRSIRGSNSSARTQSSGQKLNNCRICRSKVSECNVRGSKNLNTRKIHRFKDQHRHNPQAQKLST
jgi:hypothetical protein